MRARNREINIFNMSLLDILCGALGAFCFMMIVLLPYYKPGTGADAAKQQELDETLKDIDKLKEKLKDAELAKELAELIEKLRAQIKELEGRANSLAAQNQDLQSQVNALTARIKQLEDEKKQLEKQITNLQMREPYVVSATSTTVFDPTQSGRLHLAIWADLKGEKGGGQPPFDPAAESYEAYWNGDRVYRIEGRVPYANWMVRDVPEGGSRKVYVRLDVWNLDKADPKKKIPAKLSAPVVVFTAVASANMVEYLPDATLTPEHPWTLVGYILTDKSDNKKLVLKGATQAEREAEWKAHEKKK